MKKVYFLLAALLLFADASAQSFKLYGKITNAQLRPVQGAVVSLYDGCYRILSDSSGNFVFNELPVNSYQLKISKEGYQTSYQSVTISRKDIFVTLVLHQEIHQLRNVIITDHNVQTRKLEESLNVEVVNQDFIQRNLGGSLMTTLSRLPGVKNIGIGSGQSKPLIRGLGFNRVVVVEKGVKHEGQQWGADHGLELDQFAAGEVELIKGAASFMYGSDAIGGVIDVKPEPIPIASSLGGSVNLVGKTNNNLYGTSANLYGRNKRCFFNSRLTYQNYSDYRVPTDRVQVYNYQVNLYKNYLRNTAGQETNLHLNIGYIGEKFRSVFSLSNVYNKSGFFANAHGLEPRNVPAKIYDASSRDVMMPSQEVNHFKIINRSSYQTGIHQLDMEFGYQRNFRQEFSQYVNHGYMPAMYPDTMRIPMELEREFDKSVYSINLRNKISLSKHSLSIGFNGERQDNEINGWTFLVPAFKQTIAGGFAYDKFKLNDRLLLHGAVRYDYGQIRMFKYIDWFESKIVQENDTISQKIVRANQLNRSFHSLVWSAGLNYNANKLTLKANIGKSFRMPIAKELGANGVNYHYFSYERGDPSLSPEQSYQADISLGWTEEKWSVQISPFYNYFPNYIYLNPTSQQDYYYGAGNQIFQYAQSKVMRYGGEIQMKWRFLKTLSTEILGEYLYSDQLSGNKKGYGLPFSPPMTGLINLTWSPEINNGFLTSYIAIDYRITAPQNKIVPPEKKTPGYQVANLRVGANINLQKYPLVINMQIQNLFNARYLNHTSFYRLIELPEIGRNIVLSLKVPFTISK